MNKNGDTSKLAEVSTTFRHVRSIPEQFAIFIDILYLQDIIKDVIKSKITNPRSKLSDDAVELVSEIAKVMVIEASLRAAKQTSIEDRTTITLDHVEAVLPQLVFFFYY